MGMACCILILLFVQDELRYDEHHANADRIFRVEMTKIADGKAEDKASVGYPAGPTLVETFPEVLEAARLYKDLRRGYVERGDTEALERARALLAEQANLSIGDRERLFGYLEGSGRIILPEPQAMLNDAARVPSPSRFRMMLGMRSAARKASAWLPLPK